MSFDAEQAIRPELQRTERLLWSGRPAQGVRLRATDVFLVPFTLLWAGFAFFWEYQVVTGGAPFFFMLWGIPFIVVGVYIAIGRFFVDSHLRARTYYAVTDQRVMILSGLMNREVKSFTLQGLSELSLNERSDRTGTITFGAQNPMYSMWAGTAWPGMGKRLPPTFELIPEVRRVYDLIREAQHSRGTASGA